MTRAIVLGLVIAVFAGPASGRAQHAAPAPSWAQSIEVVDDGAPVMLEPGSDSRRRGTVGAGTRLGFARRVFGEGCSTGVWFETSDGLFICEAHVQLSPAPPGVAATHDATPRSILPERYAFIRVDGTRAYSHPSDYFRNDYVEALGRGFGIVITDEQTYRGVGFVRMRSHLWVARDSVRFVKGSAFRGTIIRPNEPAFAWVSESPTRVHAAPRGPARHRLDRHSLVRVAAERNGWVQLSGGGWVRATSLTRPRFVSPPDGIETHQRWIDVDLERQVLVAYEGATPRFATLISSGKPTPASQTPRGLFEIWAKLDATDMDDIERTDVPQNYSIQDVPWVQFFEKSYGFHAAFWHDDFGRRRSHGCINLSPADARTLFRFTEPMLPPGWNAILSMPQDRPTVVQVR